MKGLQHKVIEIHDTKNKEIEKILVFLKPGDHSVNVANTRKDAQAILENLKIKKREKPILTPLNICFFFLSVFFLASIIINIL